MYTPKGNLITRYHAGPDLIFSTGGGNLSIEEGIGFSIIYDTHDASERVEYTVYPVLLIMDELGTRSYYGNIDIEINDSTTPYVKAGSSITEGRIPAQYLPLHNWKRVKNTEPEDSGTIESIDIASINPQTKIYLITKIRIV
jgi:hypothetical protein